MYPAGPLKMKFIYQVIPFPDRAYKVRMPGRILKEVLENGVSKWPKYDGRFPLTSGLHMKFDP